MEKFSTFLCIVSFIIVSKLLTVTSLSTLPCNCEKLNLTSSYDLSKVVFWGKVQEVEIRDDTFTNILKIKKINGCLEKKQIRLNSYVPCGVHLKKGETYFIILNETEADSSEISSCSFILPKSDINPSDLFWIGSQMGHCNSEVYCADGSAPFSCLDSSCPDQKLWPTLCPAATKCIVNPCGGCQPQFFAETPNNLLLRVCDMCPLSQPQTSCNSASNYCGEAQTSTCLTKYKDKHKHENIYCHTSTCGVCSPNWINDHGKQVCKRQSAFKQCMDLRYIYFGNCKKKIGFGILGKTCSEILGCKRLLNGIHLFKTSLACENMCNIVNTPRENLPDISTNELSCGNGDVKVACVPESVEYYCKYIKCNGQEPTECKANPCHKCRALLTFDKHPPGDVHCKLELPEYKKCSKRSTVNCIDNLNPNCGSRPKECPQDWNLNCIIDPCTCKPTWMNEDLRYPPAACIHALKPKCVLDCPENFKCEQKEYIKNRNGLPSTYDLQCVQEACTCIPVWHAFNISAGPLFIPRIKEKCSKSSRLCCGDGDDVYKRKNCKLIESRNVELCQTIKCAIGNLNRSSCKADPCDDCNLQIWTFDGDLVDMSTCNKAEIPIASECPFNKSIHCGPDIVPNCGEKPSSCPDDWKLECRLDPCICKPFWFEIDIRHTSRECLIGLTPPCIPIHECPILPCMPIPPRFRPPGETLVCTPEKCTCRPIWLPGPKPQNNNVQAVHSKPSNPSHTHKVPVFKFKSKHD